MRIDFRQGIVSHQSSGVTQTFLSFNGSGNVDLSTTNRSTIVSIAHRNHDYIFNEDNDVTDAWIGPFNPATKYWLYWDINPLTAERTFGSTSLEPVAQSVEPGSGNIDIVSATPGGPLLGAPSDPSPGAFEVNGYFVIPENKSFNISNSTGYDGTYTVNYATYNPTLGRTTITVKEEVTLVTGSPLSYGEAALDLDTEGNPLKIIGRHWYDTITHTHYIYQGNDTWSEVLRVFAAIVYANSFSPVTINSNSYIGTQIGDDSYVKAGRILRDETARPILRDDRTFFTTESEFFADATRVDGIRLESNVVRGQLNSPAAARFTAVAWKGNEKIETAQYDDIGGTVVGMLTEDLTLGEVGAVIVQGVVTNVDWNWTAVYPVGSELWIENGMLVPIDPHVSDPGTYPYGRVPVARVLGKDTIIFEQGLGGKGDRGPAGTAGDINPATVTELGGVLLSYPPAAPEAPIVVTDNDPRFSAPPPAHTHMATTVTTNPVNGITSLNAQAALEELSLEIQDRLPLSGGTLTNFLTLHNDPNAPLHAASKQYVDSLVSGLIWLEPVCTVNMISDTVINPPGSPNPGDSYIIPAGATGAWLGIPIGNVVTWDTSSWIDRGTLLSLNPAGPRVGISMYSPTPASGTFAGHDNEIAVYNNIGVLTGFEVPATNNAVYACSGSSMFAYNQFVFNGSDWILFGGGSSVTPDNSTTVQTGNVLSVKQYSDGGIVDSTYWQGLQPTDLTSIYAPLAHAHDASSVTFVPYISPISGLGDITATTVEGALQEVYDEKASLKPSYANLAALPSAATHEGMIVYVQNDDSVRVAKNGSWEALASYPMSIPYDLAYFMGGQMLYTTHVAGSYLATRQIDLPVGLTGSRASAKIAPTSSVIYSVNVDNGTSSSSVGTLTFPAGNRLGSFTFTSPITLQPGESLDIITPTLLDPTIEDVSVTIVGCAEADYCTSITPITAQTFTFAGDNPSAFTYSNGDTIATMNTGGNWRSTFLTPTKSSGKHYFEIQLTAIPGTYSVVGISSSGAVTSFLGGLATDWGWISEDSPPGAFARKANNSVFTDYGTGWQTLNEIIGVAIDLDNAELYFSLNGIWQGGSDPSSGTAPAFTGIDTTNIRFGISLFDVGGQFTIPANISFALPTGYAILN